MQGKSRSNVLLVEILVALLFFMLSATTLVQVFSSAYQQNQRAQIETRALQEAQNVAEQLYATKDPEATLKELGFGVGHGVWVRYDENFALHVVMSSDTYGAGNIFHAQITGLYQQDTELFSFPVERYDPAVMEEASEGE